MKNSIFFSMTPGKTYRLGQKTRRIRLHYHQVELRVQSTLLMLREQIFRGLREGVPGASVSEDVVVHLLAGTKATTANGFLDVHKVSPALRIDARLGLKHRLINLLGCPFLF